MRNSSRYPCLLQTRVLPKLLSSPFRLHFLNWSSHANTLSETNGTPLNKVEISCVGYTWLKIMFQAWFQLNQWLNSHNHIQPRNHKFWSKETLGSFGMQSDPLINNIFLNLLQQESADLKGYLNLKKLLALSRQTEAVKFFSKKLDHAWHNFSQLPAT